MATYAKLLNGLTDLGIHKMQEHLDYYIDLVNKGQKSFSDALEELIDIEKKNNQLRAENACVKTAISHSSRHWMILSLTSSQESIGRKC